MPPILYSAHVRLRMRQRGVTEAQVRACIASGRRTDDGGRCVYELGDLKVVLTRRTSKVVTVLTTAVHLLPGTRFLGREHYRRLADDLGVHVWYDRAAEQHELYGSHPERVSNAVHYITTVAHASRELQCI